MPKIASSISHPLAALALQDADHPKEKLKKKKKDVSRWILHSLETTKLLCLEVSS